MRPRRTTLPTAAALFLTLATAAPGARAAERDFDGDVAFLRAHTEVVLLGEPGGARVAVVPAWQGRVMTSTAGAPAGTSYGWLNDELIASRRFVAHFNALGGEDRLWLGPEGGQFSIFFAKGDPFDLEHWQTPPLVDTEPWPVVETTASSVSFRQRGRLANYAGTALEVQLERTVRLLDRTEIVRSLGGAVPAGVRVVAFASENTLRNAGGSPWTRDGGLLSLWILGMFKPSPAATVVVPYETGPVSALGPVVNDAYFGKVPGDRLLAREGLLFFRADGRHRSKIGLSPRRARSVLGSYDADRRALTIVTFDKPQGATEYVNSMWEIQKEPLAGDVVNAYNDGPPAPGARPLGPFYELETSSPAAALAPGQDLTHVHRTLHLEGDEKALDAVARRVLGASVQQIRDALRSGPAPAAGAAAPSDATRAARKPVAAQSRLQADPAGWISVQPGPGLAGWTRLAWPATAELGPQQWSVDRATGHLVCEGTGGHDWLRLDRELADAVFHVEWRFTPLPGGAKYNSGVLVRTAADQSLWHQAQVGGVRSGFLFGLTPVAGKPQRVNLSDRLSSFRVREPGEWNVFELSARGRTISLWVNGAVTSEMTVDVPRGHFGLEGEGYRIEFRNLKLKPLD